MTINSWYKTSPNGRFILRTTWLISDIAPVPGCQPALRTLGADPWMIPPGSWICSGCGRLTKQSFLLWFQGRALFVSHALPPTWWTYSCSCTSNQMWQRVATRIPIGFVAKALGLVIQSSTIHDQNKHPPTSFASENPTMIRESNNNLTWSCLKIWNSQIHPVNLYLCKLCIIIFPTEIAIFCIIPLHFKTNLAVSYASSTKAPSKLAGPGQWKVIPAVLRCKLTRVPFEGFEA